jgi:hypothetical protein
MTNIKLDAPCPITLGRLENSSGFHCSSCDREIIDFRNKSTEEIIAFLSVNHACGIFNQDQVITPCFSFKNAFLFKVLTLLAILGFHVKPVAAQTTPKGQQDTSSVNKKKISGSENKKKKPEKKTWFEKRREKKMMKRRRYRIGTPAF